MQTQQTQINRVLTRAELAKYLGVSTVTVDAEVKRGLPFITVGNGVKRGSKRFRIAEVDAWYTARREMKK